MTEEELEQLEYDDEGLFQQLGEINQPPDYIVKALQNWSYLGSDIHVSAGCESEVNGRLGRAWGVMDSLDHGVWCCRTCAGG